ncbi:MAG: hypothetical protein ACRDJ5_05570, partial [Actinomycetota bacterium]
VAPGALSGEGAGAVSGAGTLSGGGAGAAPRGGGTDEAVFWASLGGGETSLSAGEVAELEDMIEASEDFDL